jgi:endoglucanase Acf2
MAIPQMLQSNSMDFIRSVFAIALSVPLFICSLYGQQSVSVGSGSYASYVPAHEGVDDFINRELYIHPSKAEVPVPTNDWWTDLIFSQYSGNMWAYPLTVSAQADGVDVYFPKEYNQSGNGMITDYPVSVTGYAEIVLEPSDQLIADFEQAGWPAGWTITGAAFGSAPANEEIVGQSFVSGFNGNGLANSFNGGDGSVGTLASPSFTVSANYIHALVGGGNHPGSAELRLLVDGDVVLSATGENSEVLKWHSWDVSGYQGQSAQIMLVDNVTGGWGHIMADQIVMTNDVEPNAKFSADFSPASAVALNWSDWHVQFRLEQNPNAYYDVTMGHGFPFVWIEAVGVRPLLELDSSAVYYNAAGNVITLPFTADCVAVDLQGRTFGLHVPAGTLFEQLGNQTLLTFDGSSQFLVVSALPAREDLLAFDNYAYAIPRDTQMNWNYDVVAARVRTDWTVTTEALEGSNLTTLQGWIPHHYRETSNDLSFNGFSYLTPRGKLKLTAANTAQIDFSFTGILPNLPTPQQLGGAHDYDPERMEAYLQNYAAKTGYGGDTYWGGKSLTQFGDYLTMAADMDSTAQDELKVSLSAALTDWFTYSSEEVEHYFARYDGYKALVGFNESYGSSEFTDHHFHYGYFTRSAALLGLQDAQFLAEYGPMARLVAKQYANWERSDTEFPFLRTFDLWHGHSYAGGTSAGNGNNQESSSESMQSWTGLFLLGEAMDDSAMAAAGAMGYAIERLAIKEYWNDYHGNPAASAPVLGDGGTIPEAYGHDMAGILFDNGPAFATFFSGEPAWVYGIQWLPVHPGMAYLGEDPAFSKAQMASMINDRVPTMGSSARGVIRDYNLAPARNEWYNAQYDGALQKFAGAIRLAYEHNPDYTTAATAANPLYINGQLCFTVEGDGAITLDTSIWSQSTLANYPALVPPVVGQPLDGWALYDYLYVNYNYDEAYLLDLWSFDVMNYQSGVDTDQAKKIIGAWGEGLGNVILSFMAHYDADMVAELMDEFYADEHGIGIGNDTSGLTYYNTHALRSLGRIVYDRHTDIPTSQVFYNDATSQYCYAVYNPKDSEQVATVYANGAVIGFFPVPAKTVVQHQLDQALESLEIVASDTDPTIVAGESVQFQVIGFDQYEATHPLSDVSWSVSAGGTISHQGLFTATANADPVVVTVTADGLQRNYHFRVGDAPMLQSVVASPAFSRVVTGGTASFTASGLDQYGDGYTLSTLTWAVDGGGTIDANGAFTSNGETGAFYVIADNGSFVETSVVAVHAPLLNIALGCSTSGSSGVGTDQIVDGDVATRWESTHGNDDEWIAIDLGAVHDLQRVFIMWETARASDYALQVSNDGSTWQTVATVQKSGDLEDDLSLNATARYVRMQGYSRATGYGYSIFEFEVYGSLSSSSIEATTCILNPPAVDLALGLDTQFKAYVFDANVSGGLTNEVNWQASAGDIDAGGLYSATEAGGPFTVTATYTGIVVAGGALSVVALVNVLGGGLSNVALAGVATASSVENAGTAAQNANDGDLATRWSSDFTDDEQLTIDLGAPQQIESVKLHWEEAHATVYALEVSSDGSSWTSQFTVSNSQGGIEEHVLATTARYVRMQGIQRATAWGYSLYEFEVFAYGATPVIPDENLDLAAGQPVVASSKEGPFAAVNAVDADSGSRWSSLFTDDEWIYVDLGSVQSLSQIVLNWEGAYGSSYKIQVSDDATMWTDAFSETAGDGGEDVINLSATGRYVRMLGVARATPWGYSLYEFEVY